MPATYEPIATNTVTGSAAANVTFSSIPSTYTDLVLICTTQMTGASHTLLQFNSDTGTNYSSTIVYGTGSAAGSGRASNAAFVQHGVADEDNSGSTFSTVFYQIMSYANTNVNKTVLHSIGNPNSEVTRAVSLWRSTSAIDTIKIYPSNSKSYEVGCVFSLYGIKAA